MVVSDEFFGHREGVRTARDRERGGVFTRSSDDNLDLDIAFDLLGAQRRRLLLRFFYLNEIETASFNEVASYIDRWESRIGDRPSSSVEDIELSLIHNHLPRLEGADVVTVDRTTGTIQYESSDALEHILDAAIDVSIIP